MLQDESRDPHIVGRDRHCRSKGRYSGSCRAPHLFVDGVLRGQGAIKSGIHVACACDVAEIALPLALSANSSATGQGLKRYLIQAFALLTRDPAKSPVQSVGHIADGVLHVLIVGSGTKCKRVPQSGRA